MLTFKNLQDRVYNQLKEDSADPNFWSNQEVKDALNDSYMFIADECMCFRLIRVVEIRVGIRSYKLPSNYIVGSLNRVEFDSEMINPVTSMELDLFNSRWRITQASRIRNYLPPGDIANTDEISVYPLPDTAGAVYNLASDSEDTGVITAVNNDTYEEFERDEGVVVATTGDPQFTQQDGAVIDIADPTDNLRIFAAKYPKRLFDDNEVFLHPISEDPRRVLTKGSLSILFEKEGEGKDISKASFYNKRFNEAMSNLLLRPKVKRKNVMRSISEFNRSRATLGEHYGRIL